jgi:hypothetical protein
MILRADYFAFWVSNGKDYFLSPRPKLHLEGNVQKTYRKLKFENGGGTFCFILFG